MDDILLVVSGILVLLYRCDRNHAFLWGAISLYWVLGGIIQDVMGSNSIPYANMVMALCVATVATIIAERRKRYWPFWIAVFMILSAVADIVYAAHFEFNGLSARLRSIYQNTTYLLYYASLISLCHPKLRGVSVGDAKWSYT